MSWIRIETNVAENDKVIAFAEACGISAEAGLGFLVRFWGRVAEHRTDGDLTGMTDQALERWAGWNGMPTVLAMALRKLFITNGILDGWRERQGKLIERAAKERARKRCGTSEESPPLRNDTVRNVVPTSVLPTVVPTASPVENPPAWNDVLAPLIRQHIAPRYPAGDGWTHDRDLTICRNALKHGLSVDELADAVRGLPLVMPIGTLTLRLLYTASGGEMPLYRRAIAAYRKAQEPPLRRDPYAAPRAPERIAETVARLTPPIAGAGA